MAGHSLLEYLSFTFSLLSFLAIAELWRNLFRWVRIRPRGRAILRFKQYRVKKNHLAVVISTSTNNDPPERWAEGIVAGTGADQARCDEPSYPRATVSIWTTYAVTDITELSSVLGYRKSFDVDISERLQQNQEEDLVLIGGEIKNKRAADFVARFNTEYPHLGVERANLDHPCEKLLKIGEKNYSTTLDTDSHNEIIADRAIIMMWKNPFLAGSTWRRGIMCAGFTSRGTAAATQYLSKVIHDGTLRERCLAHDISVGPLGEAPEFILVLDVKIINDRYSDSEEVDFIPIRKHVRPVEFKDNAHERDAAVGH